MEKTIKIGDQDIVVKELTYLQAVEIEQVKETDLREAIKKMMLYSTGMPEEIIEKLTIKEGLEIQKAIGELNVVSDFQIPTAEIDSEQS